jgi:signal peptidase I
MKRPGVAAALLSYALIAGVCLISLRWYEPIRVSGDSMRPALHAGDMVLVARGHRPLQGRIALLEGDGGRLVLHRIVGTNSDGSVRTKGDANDSIDPEAVQASSVRGTVVVVIPVGRLLRRWHDRVSLRYTLGSTEQH